MNKLLFIFGARGLGTTLALGFLLILSSCASWQLQQTSGGVTVTRGGSSIPISTGMKLQKNDAIQTSAGSTAYITMGDDTFKLLPDTRVEIHSLWLDFGELMAWVNGAFTVESDGASAGVTGTEFYVKKRGNTEMEVVVFEGGVTLHSKGTNRREFLRESERAQVLRNSSYTLDRKIMINRAELSKLRTTIGAKRPALAGRFTDLKPKPSGNVIKPARRLTPGATIPILDPKDNPVRTAPTHSEIGPR